jgi:predicted transcriptional regulator
MSKTAVVTARLDADTIAALDRLASFHDRSKSWLVARAVSKYVKEETEFFAFLQEGDDAIDRGEFVTQDQMKAWAASLDRQIDAA